MQYSMQSHFTVYFFGIQHTKQKTPSDGKKMWVGAHSTTHDFVLETLVGSFRRKEGGFFHAYFSFRKQNNLSGILLCFFSFGGDFSPLLCSFEILGFCCVPFFVFWLIFVLMPGSLVCSSTLPPIPWCHYPPLSLQTPQPTASRRTAFSTGATSIEISLFFFVKRLGACPRDRNQHLPTTCFSRGVSNPG